MVCFSEPSNDHLNLLGMCVSRSYFLVVKKQTAEVNVNTEHSYSLALSACHAAACRCCFVQEHAVPLIAKSRLSFGEFTG